MRGQKYVWFLVPIFLVQYSYAEQQESNVEFQAAKVQDVDTAYVEAFKRPNEIRLFYGTQGSSLEFGSVREVDAEIPTSLYNNVNDFIGVGITYKILDADLSFSLPQTRLMEEDRDNLDQFRFSLSYTGRRFALRGLLTNANGVIVTDPLARFESTADVHQFRVCGQLTYIFNHQKYSYRAAMFQNELQRKTAGSFLLRVEPFYRGLGAGSALVPSTYDNMQTYGDQAGLQYLNAVGVLAMPGYGITITPLGERFYVSTLAFAGPGVAFNYYQARESKYTYTNWEWAGMAAFNVGYNGPITYLNLNMTTDINHIPLNPAYFTSTNLKISLTFGFRFMHLENFIPSSI